MAYIVDQQSNFKHFCKICKKGFGCGRALGGHMRAHGIGDESGHIDDEDLASDWEEKLGANDPPSNKRMYALRTNPNRLKSCRVCENCGKEFLSWKSFLEHGKCSTSEDAESLVSSPGSDGEDGSARRGCGWSKKKRSLRTKIGNYNSNNTPCPSSEEEELANCLMMLSNATVDPLEAEPEESCASASKELEERRNNTMNFIASVACRSLPLDHNKAKGVASTKGMFECKACKKVFNSHQALGGHRASHKKVKGCFAARLDHMDDSLVDEDHDVITNEDFFPTNHNHHKSTATNLQFDHGINTPALPSTSKRKSKVHECSICHRVFSSGQALGGHKRCHWITSNSPADTSSLAKFHNQFSSSNNINNNNNINIHDQMEQHHLQQPRQKFVDNNNINNSDPLDLKLDLNLPAPVIDHDPAAGLRREQVNTSSFDVSTEIYLQPWINVDAKEKNKDHNHDHNQINQTVKIDKNDNRNNCSSSMQINVEDEADSKVKLAKLSELKDMNASGSSSPWLQVGIGSTTNDVGTDQL